MRILASFIVWQAAIQAASEGVCSSGLEPTQVCKTMVSECTDALHQVVRTADTYFVELSTRDERVRARLEACLRHRWITARVRIFGSSASGLRIGHSSDVDLCVTLPPHEMRTAQHKKKSIYAIAAIMENSMQNGSAAWAYGKMEKIAHARVPLVKCLDLHDGVNCDIVPGAEVAVHNSALLAAFCAQQPLCRELILLVKLWASRRRLNSARDGGLSSYGFALTCIHFCLAGTSPPLLADLLSPDKAAEDVSGGGSCHGFDVRYRRRNVPPPPSHLPSPSTKLPLELSSLATGYFEYLLTHWQEDVLSLRPHASGTYRFRKAEWRHAGKKSTAANRLSIEDPFETAGSHTPHDVGRTLTAEAFAGLKEEWMRAVELLRASMSAATAEAARDAIAELICPKPPVMPVSAPKWAKQATGRRVDDDGNAYTALEFLEYYGYGPEVAKRWKQAAPEPRDEAEVLVVKPEATHARDEARDEAELHLRALTAKLEAVHLDHGGTFGDVPAPASAPARSAMGDAQHDGRRRSRGRRGGPRRAPQLAAVAIAEEHSRYG